MSEHVYCSIIHGGKNKTQNQKQSARPRDNG